LVACDLALVEMILNDRPALAAALKLPDIAKVVLAQTVGWPKK